MPSSSVSEREPYAGRGELVGLIRRMKALTLELSELREQGSAIRELEARARTLDQLRWRMTTVARRTAADLGAAG